MKESVKLSCVVFLTVILFCGCDWFRESKQVVQEELGPKELL